MYQTSGQCAHFRWCSWYLRVDCRSVAWKGCHWLEQDIIKTRQLIADRREAYLEGRRRFRRGGNFTTDVVVYARQEFGKQRDAMRLEEAKIKQLEEYLDRLVAKHKRRCS
eukprot:4624627-Amphidinium_carterae.1